MGPARMDCQDTRPTAGHGVCYVRVSTTKLDCTASLLIEFALLWLDVVDDHLNRLANELLSEELLSLVRPVGLLGIGRSVV